MTQPATELEEREPRAIMLTAQEMDVIMGAMNLALCIVASLEGGQPFVRISRATTTMRDLVRGVGLERFMEIGDAIAEKGLSEWPEMRAALLAAQPATGGLPS